MLSIECLDYLTTLATAQTLLNVKPISLAADTAFNHPHDQRLSLIRTAL